MQPLQHNPGVLGVGNQVIANGSRGLATGTAATTEAAALIPAGAEEVSAQAVMAFASESVQMAALNAYAQQELARTGAAYLEATGIYTTVDAESAATLS
ncbi:PbsX family transcriptional regulator [Mycobacterium sp. Root265]|uniref:PE family protein n=1 Tax=Mycobacterium sp. Root265 TaxID=1736504 RepID=UPI00070C4D2A|nr:PE family protein [Mycobacterium sp. Root265]KRD07740.1 PbsX family transcriptional regulator [Mycobacterium sp. Root265]